MKKDDAKFRNVVGYNFRLRVLRDRVGLFMISIFVILVAVHFLKTRESNILYFANNKVVSIILLIVGIGAAICSCLGFIWKTDYAKYDRMKYIVGKGDVLYENAYLAIVDSVFIDKHNYLNMFYIDEVYKIEVKDRKSYNALQERPEIKIHTGDKTYDLNVSRLSMTSANELADVIEEIAPNIGRKEEVIRIAKREVLNPVDHIVPSISGRIHFDDGDYYKYSNNLIFYAAAVVGLITLFIALVFGGTELRHDIQYADLNDKTSTIDKDNYPIKGSLENVYGEINVDINCGLSSSSKVRKYVLPYKDKLILFCDKDGVMDKDKTFKFHAYTKELTEKELSDCNEIIKSANIDTKGNNKEFHNYCVMTREEDRNLYIITALVCGLITLLCVFIMIKSKK